MKYKMWNTFEKIEHKISHRYYLTYHLIDKIDYWSMRKIVSGLIGNYDKIVYSNRRAIENNISNIIRTKLTNYE